MRRLAATPTDTWGPLPPHATPRRNSSLLRHVERILLAIAVVCLGYYGYVWGETQLYQAYENRELDAILQSAPPPERPTRATAAAPRRAEPAPGSPIGRIEIPRLGVSSIVRAGSDARTLQLAVGHIPGTALPGESGNMGLAGHRDTFFRRLRDIQADDIIRVVTPEGTFLYRVERTNVVNPTDVWVLDPTPDSTLTLVTCYPFTYVGSAPQRFIVRATLDKPTHAVRAAG
jgi:sortase A